jgi:hypothetical protein
MVFPGYTYGLYVAAVEIKEDKKGNAIEESFRDTLGNPAPDDAGVYMYKMKYDKEARNVETRYLGQNGKDTAQGDYVVYDGKNVVESGKLRLNDTIRIPLEKACYKKNGDPVEYLYYDMDDSLELSHFRYSIQYRYDKKGHFLSYSFRDSTDRLIGQSHWGLFAYVQYTYDKKNRVSEIGWYDKDSDFVRTPSYLSYYARIIFEYDKWGRLSEIKLLDAEGNGSSGVIDQNDARDVYESESELETFRPFSRKEYHYDWLGRVILEEFYDQYSQKTVSESYRYFLWFLTKTNRWER